MPEMRLADLPKIGENPRGPKHVRKALFIAYSTWGVCDSLGQSEEIKISTPVRSINAAETFLLFHGTTYNIQYNNIIEG